MDSLLNGPALAPPAGVTPNFDSPPGNNALAYGALTTCLVFTVFAVIIRIYAKLVCVKKVHVEDYMAFIGFGTFIGFMYLSYYRFSFLPAFAHQWDVRFKDLGDSLYVLFVGSVLYAVTVMLVKAAILQEWRRIFLPLGTKNTFYYTCYALMVFNILFYSASVIAICLQCTPYARIWDKTITEGSCISTTTLEIAGAVINLASDLIVLILPQKTIWRLQMSMRNKIGVSVVFAVGILACVAGSFRLAATTQFLYSDDIIYDVTALTLWACAEMTCAFLVFCVPSIPKVVRTMGLLSKILSSLRSINSKLTGRRTDDAGVSWGSLDSRKVAHGGHYNQPQPGEIPLQHGLGEQPTASSERLNQGYTDRSGIVKTTQLSTSDYPVQSGDVSYGYAREAPWAGMHTPNAWELGSGNKV